MNSRCRYHLLRHTSQFNEAQVIGRHISSTDPSWRFTQTADQMTSIAGPMLLRGLLDALSDENAFFNNLPPSTPVKDTSSEVPTAIETMPFSARTRHSFVCAPAKNAACTGGGFLPFAREANSELEQLRPKASGKSRSRSAPSMRIRSRNKQHWLFFEEVPAGRTTGRLSAAELREDGTLGEPFVILEKPYHLSYPMVFEHAGEVYFIPESAKGSVVELYRATDFPTKWELASTLMNGLSLVDTTVFFHNGLWFFFTTTRAPVSRTFLFFSESLDGAWHYHPRNPICSDVRRARGAGAPFFRDGKLMRPAQDSSTRLWRRDCS